MTGVRTDPGSRQLVDVLVSRLRRKFSDSNFTVPIKSVRNVGYVLPKPATMVGSAKEYVDSCPAGMNCGKLASEWT